MNNNSLSSLIDNRISILNKYGLDDKSIKEFRSKIKRASDSEKESLGSELLNTISKKGFNDDFNRVLELIYNGADIEYKNSKKGDYALLICARKNYIKTFITLIKAGANVDQVNDYLTTAVMASARHGNKEILEILILFGADINKRCLDGDSALMSAKMHNQSECFNMLVQAGAYINNINFLNQTFLDSSGSVEFDKSIFERDIEISKKEEPKDLINEVEETLESYREDIKKLIYK